MEDGARFCPKCGKPVADEAEAQPGESGPGIDGAEGAAPQPVKAVGEGELTGDVPVSVEVADKEESAVEPSSDADAEAAGTLLAQSVVKSPF